MDALLDPIPGPLHHSSPMKIALVHKQFTLRGGTERYLVGLACYLAEREHDVHVFCDKVDPILSGIRGITFHRLWIPRLGGLLKVLGFWISSLLTVKRADFDVVHGFGRTTGHHMLRAGGGCHRAYFQGVLARAKTAWERFRLQFSLRQRLMLWIERQQLAEPTLKRFMVVSSRNRRELEANYPIRDGLLQVVHNGVDTQRFHPKNRALFFVEAREEFHLVPEDTVILFVGSDWDRKGLDSAIRVLAELKERNDLKLLVVGHDRRFERFMQLAAELGVLEQVHLTGSLDRIERVYATVDLLLLPTRYDPFANVTLEALASEIPVVTTATNGAAEVLGDCEAVRIVDDPEDVEGMVNAVRALLDHPEQERLREAAREAALQNRDEDNYREVESIYREIAARRRRGGRP